MMSAVPGVISASWWARSGPSDAKPSAAAISSQSAVASAVAGYASTSVAPVPANRSTAAANARLTSGSTAANAPSTENATRNPVRPSRAPAAAAAAKSRSPPGYDMSSAASTPAMTSSSVAASRTLRVSGPMIDSVFHPGNHGSLGTRPKVDLTPTKPQYDAGMRTEPPPSVPMASGVIPAATDAPAPPLEPPGVRSRFQGLRVIPQSALSV